MTKNPRDKRKPGRVSKHSAYVLKGKEASSTPPDSADLEPSAAEEEEEESEEDSESASSNEGPDHSEGE